MNYSLEQIRKALEQLSVNDGEKGLAIGKINEAKVLLAESLSKLDGLTVQGRTSLDTLLGCMMAIDAIIGDDKNG